MLQMTKQQFDSFWPVLRAHIDQEKVMKAKILLPVLLALSTTLSACGANPRKQEIGMVSGAVVGGVVGSALTAGSTAGTVAGAAAGGLVGRRIAKDLER